MVVIIVLLVLFLVLFLIGWLIHWFVQNALAQADIARVQREKEKVRQQRDQQAEVEAKQAAFQRLEAKAQVWINRAHEEPWFLDAEFRLAFAKAHHKEILGELGQSWCQDRRTMMEDEALHHYLEIKAPTVIEWLEMRVQLLDLAQRAAIDLLEEEAPKQSPEAWEAKQRGHAQRMAEREFREAEQSIRLALDYVLSMEQLQHDLVQKHPDKAAEIADLFRQYQLLKSTPPPSEPKEPASYVPTAPAPLGPEVL